MRLRFKLVDHSVQTGEKLEQSILTLRLRFAASLYLLRFTRCERCATFLLILSPLSPCGRGAGGEGSSCTAFQTASAMASHSSKSSLFQYRRIPEALRLQPLIAHPVVLSLRFLVMLAAVQLDDQSLFEADEVDKVFPERELTAKFQAFERSVAKLPPEKCLRFAGKVSKLPRAVPKVSQRPAPLTPDPSPARGEGNKSFWLSRRGRREKEPLASPDPFSRRRYTLLLSVNHSLWLPIVGRCDAACSPGCHVP
jgi:hypothetical protein